MSITSMNPYLNFEGTAEQAIKLYERALGARVELMQRFGEMSKESKTPERIMHARLVIGGNLVMISDCMPGQRLSAGGSTSICLHFDDVNELLQRFDALAAGGTVTMAPHDTFWGAKFGTLTDAYGVQWMLNCMTTHGAR